MGGGTITTISCFPKMSLVQLTTISPIQEHVKSGSLTKQTLVIEEFYWYDLGLFSTLIYAFPLDIRTNPLKALIEHFQSGALPLVATQLRNNHQMNTLIRNNKGGGGYLLTKAAAQNGNPDSAATGRYTF